MNEVIANYIDSQSYNKIIQGSKRRNGVEIQRKLPILQNTHLKKISCKQHSLS